jgi:hypothetical protein
VYAIDVHSGTVLLSPKFRNAGVYPLGCNNNGPNVGITATPVIDLATKTLYAMMYTQETSGPAYHLHALDLGSLTDKVKPQLVTASHTLTDGTTFTFNATYQRQRPALLLANGASMPGFGSFCDLSANVSRGWLLAWTAGTLAPFPANQLWTTRPLRRTPSFCRPSGCRGTDRPPTMPATILFVTGNSDYSGNTYDGVTNIQESVVKVSSDADHCAGPVYPKRPAQLDEDDRISAPAECWCCPISRDRLRIWRLNSSTASTIRVITT